MRITDANTNRLAFHRSSCPSCSSWFPRELDESRQPRAWRLERAQSLLGPIFVRPVGAIHVEFPQMDQRPHGCAELLERRSTAELQPAQKRRQRRHFVEHVQRRQCERVKPRHIGRVVFTLRRTKGRCSKD